MARKPGTDFTDVEFEIMRILWEQGQCSSDTIRNLMPGIKRKESTVRTLLGIMEKKGYVTHTTQGRMFVYEALVRQETARRRSMRRLLDKVFDGSPELLLQCLVDSSELDSKTAEQIQDALQGADRD